MNIFPLFYCFYCFNYPRRFPMTCVPIASQLVCPSRPSPALTNHPKDVLYTKRMGGGMGLSESDFEVQMSHRTGCVD